MEFLYECIKKLREEHGFSQDELARMVGYTSRSTIARIEAGEIDIPQSKIIAFAKALKCEPSYLMGWDESEKRAYLEMEYPATKSDDGYSEVERAILAGYHNAPENVRRAVETLLGVQRQEE